MSELPQSFEIGDAQYGGVMSWRWLWIGLAVVAAAFAWEFRHDSSWFWASIIGGAVALAVGLSGHSKPVVDGSKREIRQSLTYLWGETPRRVVPFDDVTGSHVTYEVSGESSTFFPRLILRSGDTLNLLATGCETKSEAEELVRRIVTAIRADR